MVARFLTRVRSSLNRVKEELMTAAQLAKELNLSRSTVSLVLNGRAERYGLSQRTVEKVLTAARRFKYQPDPVARQLAGMRSNVVGILANSSKLVDPRLIEKMEVFAAERQLRFFIGYATGSIEKMRQYLADFQSRRVDAVISFSHNQPKYRDVALNELQELPRVLYYEKPIGPVKNAWFVEVDYYEMGRLAAEHLIQRGCKRIGLVGLDENVFPVLEQRRRGFLDALRDAGLPCGPEKVWHVDREHSLEWIAPPGEQEAKAVIEKFVVKQNLDGLFAVNDLYVARLIHVLRGQGRSVPRDLALIGADNMDIATLVEPQITTIDVQIDQLARATVDLLFEMLHQDEGDSGAGQRGRSTAVKPKLIVRESA